MAHPPPVEEAGALVVSTFQASTLTTDRFADRLNRTFYKPGVVSDMNESPPVDLGGVLPATWRMETCRRLLVAALSVYVQ